jgi:hypothetical protein
MWNLRQVPESDLYPASRGSALHKTHLLLFHQGLSNVGLAFGLEKGQYIRSCSTLVSYHGKDGVFMTHPSAT